MSWLKLFKPRIEYRILEVDKAQPRLSDADAKNIASLEHHPGLESLLARLRIQRAVLETQLKSIEHTSLNAVYNLQNGIRWIGWLEKQIAFYANRKEAIARETYALEEAELKRMVEALKIVGRNETV